MEQLENYTKLLDSNPQGPGFMDNKKKTTAQIGIFHSEKVRTETMPKPNRAYHG